ncbi:MULTISPECIES: PTS mannose/fructose/sorbose/N-acetylgalactosamine transporter subunit IIC [Anaerostipes]|uniref:PTS mannose transporter subunit IIA n=1 Tax=Anaerostipes butyraticus TaxID=645466 RepID=A0A916Q6G2_9FIRM|nr:MULTISPECIES: PTS sugar transporter subunit IIC [Anaerostipes]GFO85279.1 PTS mannose transporter subunit IIA [Anaerostipes butyraticus]
MEISIIQAVLCGIVYWLAVGNLPFVGLWSLQRPLVCGLVTGLILGHPVQGAVIGATINLVYLGFMSAGGSMPADMALAGILGTAYAIAGGLDTDTALALAVPIGILGTIVWAGRMTFDSFFVHIADNYIEKEEYHKIWRANVLFPQIMCFCMTAIPCAFAAYFGANYIQGIINMLSGKVLTVFQIIGGLMPALGIAITLQYIFKGESRIFLFAGFLLAVYSGLPLLTLGIIALIVAIVYVQMTSVNEAAAATAAYDDEDDEEDD